MQTPEQIVLNLILPPGVLEWFDIIKGVGDHDQIQIILEEKISFQKTVSVIVTFLEEKPLEPTKKILSSFNFKKSQQLSAHLKTSLSDSLIEERRENEWKLF